MTDTAEIQAAKKIASITGTGVNQRVLKGQYGGPSSLPVKLGAFPTAEIVGAKSGDWKRMLTPAQSRAAVNKYMNNANSEIGKALNKYLGNSETQGVFNKLGSMPGRLALTAVESNNAIDKTEALKMALELIVPYVNEHAGGIIGDAIKEEYFQAGRAKWAPLHPNTIRDKKNAGKKGNRRKGRYPRPEIPLYGITFTATLPDGWYAYTYRWGNFPYGGVRMPGPRMGGKAGIATPGLQNKKYLKSTRRSLSTYTAGNIGGPGKLRSQSGFFTEPYKMSDGKVAYPPSMRGGALMDIVANLVPAAQVVRPYAGRGYQEALKAAAAAKEPSGQAHMKIDNVLQPFYIAPYVFYHEEGRGNNPRRPFLTPGLALGMGRVEQLFLAHMNAQEKNFKKAYQETEVDGLRDHNELAALYQAGSDAAGDALRLTKFRGKAGLKNEPRYANFDMFDNMFTKQHTMKKMVRQMFGNHLIWWFVPPSKYWHYIGMASDIYGLLYGKKNTGAAIAYVKAMSIGLAGARAGTPVPFTRKARRRKFRQNLYTRAGYHRTQVGGRS